MKTKEKVLRYKYRDSISKIMSLKFQLGSLKIKC